ncbi:hypothetical protein OS493_025673 [Desmophyllum pertusum]|uniref:Uncharacterized protein n=1 Tax=Desmophyllum pertusum TaxID=174260 RepID=A0A9W9ZZW8_9CNID|nr:hypothetical protein OS493_025673 [Desmophyllum pertusum]
MERHRENKVNKFRWVRALNSDIEMTSLRIFYIVLSSYLHMVEGDGSKPLSLQATEWYRNSVNYWPFEDVSNGTAIDYTGSNHGRIGGRFHSVSGLVGSALELTGISLGWTSAFYRVLV